MGRHLSKLAELGAKLAAEQDEVVLEASERRALRARLVEAENLTRRANWFSRMGSPARLSAFAVVALAAAVALWFNAKRARALQFSYLQNQQKVAGQPGTWLSAPERAKLPIDFSDGSRVVLNEKTRARVVQTGPSGADLLVENGRATISVVPRHGTRWNVNAGPFDVRVTGTRFDVDWDPASEQFSLSLHEGHVIVSGCALGEGRDVYVGETLRASCRDESVVIRNDANGTTPSAVEPVQSSVSNQLPAPPSPASVPTPTPALSAQGGNISGDTLVDENARWRSLLRSRQFADAVKAARSSGFGRICDQASMADVLALGDAARLTGDSAGAAQAYSGIRRRFPHTEQAHVAAFALGRLAFDGRGAYDEAAKWLSVYLAESPNGPLAREALGRLLEAKDRLGDRGGARQVAQEYLRRYPSGPSSPLAQRLAGE